MSEWPRVALGSQTTKIGSGATPRGGESVYQSHGVSLIRSQNVLDNSMRVGDIARISDAAAEALRGVTVEANDVLINITGDSVARCATVNAAVLPARVNQHVAILRPRPSLDSRFLQKLLVAPDMKSHLLAIATAGGTRNALTKAQLSDLHIPLPPLSEQQAIAEVLGALDDKIAANTALAKTAWALMETDFRAIQVAPERVRATLGALASLEYGKALPASAREHGAVAVVGSGGVSGTHSLALVPKSGVVVGRKGSAGAVHWVSGPHFPIDTTFYVRGQRDSVSQQYLYFLLRTLHLDEMNNDSAVPGLNRAEALALPVELPADTHLNAFTSRADVLIDLVDSVAAESRTLAATRDALLPQLMSGKLRVRDAENLIVQAGV